MSISENEIYFKRQPLTEEQKKHGSYVDENGNLHVKNLSAFWIPELTDVYKRQDKVCVWLSSKAGEVYVCENAAYHPYSEDEAAKVLRCV